MSKPPQRPPDLALDRGEFVPVLALCALEIPLASIEALAHEASAQGCTLSELVRRKLDRNRKTKRRKGGTDHEAAVVRHLAG
jgi:hypothetical protein